MSVTGSTPPQGATAGTTPTATTVGTAAGAVSVPVTSAPTTGAGGLPFTGPGQLPEEIALGGVLIALGVAIRRLTRPRSVTR